MKYTKNIWTDQKVARPKTYKFNQNSDGTTTLIDDFGVVTDIGTPVNAANMNHIEDGIVNAATIDLDNLSSNGNAKLNNKANIDLNNLSASGQNVLNNKLNKDHSNDTKPYVKEIYVNGKSGYMLWSDKLCKQWGEGSSKITFLKAYKDTNYSVCGSVIGGSSRAYTMGIASKNVAYFTIVTGTATNTGVGISNNTISWQAIGYIN